MMLTARGYLKRIDANAHTLGMDDELVWCSASDLATLISSRQVSSHQATRAHLDRIAAVNPAINAVITLDADGALEQATAADAASSRGEATGRLHGVPMTLKDSHSVAGMRTSAGYPPLADHVPTTDGTVAARLRAAGAVLVGHTNVPRLLVDYQAANELHGRTSNPWDPARTSGGSSGGAAAALAAGMTPLEIGSDIGGSIRIPAHCCGVFGLKPTEHRIPISGHLPPLPGRPTGERVLLSVGPMARSLDDLELALRLLAGPDGRDTEVAPVPLTDEPVRPVHQLRLAWASRFPSAPIAAELASAVERLAGNLEAAGAQVVEALPPVDFVAQGRLRVELMKAVSGVFGEPDPQGYEPRDMGWYLEALHQRDRYIAAWEAFLEPYDAFLCPPAMTVAFPHCDMGAQLDVDGERVGYWSYGRYATPFNLTGQPSLSVPLTTSADGLPIGLQIVGPRWSEMRLLRVARALEAGGLLPGFRRPAGL
jgi:amidase